MKKVKTSIIIAVSLIIIGGIIFGGVMMMLKWDFTKLSTVKYETNNYAINENYKNIQISTDTADIEFIPSGDLKSAIVCYEQKNAKHSVSVKNDTLFIEYTDTRKWYEHIGIFFGSPKITVYIPSGQYGALSITANTGNVSIPKDFKFESIDIVLSTGNVANYAAALKDIKIRTSTGNILAENISAETLNLSVSTGKVNLSNITCKNVVSSGDTGNVSLKNVIATEKFSIKRSTGHINLEKCDAAEIFAETDTGDIIGTLLSEKIFITKTDTGSINVPKTVTGGRCEITTDTGDINIEIQQ